MRLPAEVKNYNARYYEKNRKTILEKRRARYMADPNYRKKIQKKARKRYVKKPNKLLGYTIKKKAGVELYTIRYASKVSGRTESTIRIWEKEGIVPLTTFTDSRGWRLYTADQISLLSMSFKEFDSGVWGKQEVKKFLSDYWEKETSI